MPQEWRDLRPGLNGSFKRRYPRKYCECVVSVSGIMDAIQSASFRLRKANVLIHLIEEFEEANGRMK